MPDEIPAPQAPKPRLQTWLNRVVAAARRRPQWSLTVGCVLLLAAVTHGAFRGFVFDDAFITYRYAQNASSGEGLAFNPGERVLGTSSPLQALVLAASASIGLDIADTGGVLYVLGWSATALLGAAALMAAGSPNAAMLFAVWLFVGLGHLRSYWGMETATYAALLIGSVHLARRGRDGWAGVVAGLAVLTRYDGGVGALVLAALLAWQRRRFPLRYATAGVAVTAPWLVFAQLYYGSFLPNTLDAKAQTVPTLQYLSEVLRAHVLGASPLARLEIPSLGDPFFSILFAFLLAGGLFVGSRALARRDPWALYYGATALLLWIAYGQIGPPSVHHWHMAPAAILAGLFFCGSWAAAVEKRRATTILCIALVLITVGRLPSTIRRTADRFTNSEVYRNRTVAYGDIAQWLRSNDLTDLRVMTAEPGYLAYLSNNPVTDLAGLVTQSGLFTHGPSQRRQSLQEAVDEHAPDLVVLHPGTDPRFEVTGYVTVFHAFSTRRLSMRRDLYDDRFADLWGPDGPINRMPYVVEMGPAPWRISVDSDLEALRRGDAFLPSPSMVPVEDGFVRAFSTGRGGSPWSGMETPVFMIDFDLLEIEFQGTHASKTIAQLIVDGQVVFEAGGQNRWLEGRFAAAKTLYWPVDSWHGRLARVRFVDVGGEGHRVMFTSIEAKQGRSSLWQGFESAEHDWTVTLEQDAKPAHRLPWRMLARRAGYPVKTEGWSLSSLGIEGLVAVDSPPFAMPRNLSFVTFDACSKRCALELWVGDRRVRRLGFDGSRKLAATTWASERLEGKQAVLRLIDAAGRADVGVALDDITFGEPP